MKLNLVRALARAAVSVLYRVSISHSSHVPKTGGAVLVSNHVSYLDAIMIAGSTKRDVRYVMYAPIFNKAPGFFRALGAIPIASKTEFPEVYHEAMADIAATLRDGGVVCIFPEGAITRDGELHEFKPGVLKILAENPVPVVPISLAGMWGSYFSFRWGPSLSKVPRHFRAKIEVIFHPALPSTATLDDMRSAIASRL